MVLAYIRMYLRLRLGNLSILELNDLQKEIDSVIRDRCDQLLAMDCNDIANRIVCEVVREVTQ